VSSSETEFVYNIRNIISQARGYIYNIFKYVGNSTTVFKYNICGFVSYLIRIKYAILALTYPDLVGPYYILMNELYEYFVTKVGSGEELEGLILYRFKPRNTPLFFPCLVINFQRSNEENMFNSEYVESVTVVLEIIFTSRHNIDGLFKEELARYYTNKLINVAKDFVSPSMKLEGMQVTGVHFAPLRRQHTLYGARVTMQFSFRGVDYNWLENP
jgi:hypothetical protein